MTLGTDFRWIGDFLLTDKACAHIRIESTLHYNSLGATAPSTFLKYLEKLSMYT